MFSLINIIFTMQVQLLGVLISDLRIELCSIIKYIKESTLLALDQGPRNTRGTRACFNGDP